MDIKTKVMKEKDETFTILNRLKLVGLYSWGALLVILWAAIGIPTILFILLFRLTLFITDQVLLPVYGIIWIFFGKWYYRKLDEWIEWHTKIYDFADIQSV